MLGLKSMSKTIYLDHNILDALIKNKGVFLDDYITDEEAIFIYSKESLIEIYKSKGYEQQFLELLSSIGAYHLEVEVDMEGHPTGIWQILDSNVFEDYSRLVEMLIESGGLLFGFDKMVQKFYGGLEEQSYGQILQECMDEAIELLDALAEDCRNEPEFEQVVEQINLIKTTLYNNVKEAEYRLDDGECRNDVVGWERAIGISAKQLKNIKGPNVVEKVWDTFKRTNKVPESVSLNNLIGLEAVHEEAYVPKSDFEKANVVYQGLNFFGYYRDKGMKKHRRVLAAFSDMTHVGYASVCDVLLSNDQDLCRKAEATYEYLKVNTKVIYANFSK